MSTIPASELIRVNPSVLPAGGEAIATTGLVLTDSTRMPIGQVLSFPDGASVTDYFGAGSTEDVVANGASGKGSGYFGGFTGEAQVPGAILFAQYNTDAVAAFLRGGDVSSLTVAELQAITGSLDIVVDGVARNVASIDLSSATSFSDAASTLETALNGALSTIASFTGAISGTTLTASSISGTIAIGQTVMGSGVAAGTIITAGSGTSWTVNNSQTVGSEAMTTEGTPLTMSYDSTSGGFLITSGITGVASTIAFATGTSVAALKLTSATGAVISQGAAAAVPATFMDALVEANSNWVAFMTSFNPDNSGNTVKQAFAAWNTTQNNRFCYVCWDTDVTPTESVPASSSLGYILAHNGDSGTALIWEGTDLNHAAFVLGAIAAIDFDQAGGRLTFAYKTQAGLVAAVTTATAAANLGGDPQGSTRGNGYNFVGAYATANQDFVWLQRGFVTGAFSWLDSYINQIWMNYSFQAALLTLQLNALSIPYGTAGNGLIEAALQPVIQQALNFGAFGPGTLSATQIAQVNSQAGASIAQALQTQGYYLQIKPASATTRANRTSPQMTFWYIDNGSVQALDLSSVALQ